MKKSDEKMAKQWKTHTTMRLSIYDHEIAKKISSHMGIGVSEYMRIALREANTRYLKQLNLGGK